MIRTLQFTGFIEPARRGITRPLIIQAQAEDGQRETVYLKTIAGYADRPESAGIELFTTLLARRLGLRTPEPVLVEVPENAGRLVHDAPQHAALLSQSAGINFGTVALGPDWKVWLRDLPPRSFSEETLEMVLAFDGLVQHTDREAGNPNLMWKGQEVAVIDHEKVFGYVKRYEAEKRPWRCFFQHQPFARHVLAPGVRQLMHREFGRALWENLVELNLAGGVEECCQAAMAAFPGAEVDLGRIKAYIEGLANDAEDFFDYLKASLQP